MWSRGIVLPKRTVTQPKMCPEFDLSTTVFRFWLKQEIICFDRVFGLKKSLRNFYTVAWKPCTLKYAGFLLPGSNLICIIFLYIPKTFFKNKTFWKLTNTKLYFGCFSLPINVRTMIFVFFFWLTIA